jgi:hypothetical protein
MKKVILLLTGFISMVGMSQEQTKFTPQISISGE